jgi:hypothetical protein
MQNLDVNKVALTPDNRYIFTAGKNYNGAMHAVANSRQVLRLFEGHQQELSSIEVSSDGRLLITSSRDGTVRIWDLATGVQLICLASDDSLRNWIAVSSDGLFDGSTAGWGLLGLGFATTLPGSVMNQFFSEFYHPGLLSQVMAGERPFTQRQLGLAMPPTVGFVSPKAGRVETQNVDVVVEATDTGGGVANFTLYNNGAVVGAPGETRCNSIPHLPGLRAA